MLVPATINLGATGAVAGTVVNVVNNDSVTVPADHQLRMVVNNTGPGTLMSSTTLAGGGQRGQRQRQHRQLQRLGQRRGLPAASQSSSGGTVTVTIEVTAISTGTYTNTLTVLVPATTINLGATESAVAGTVVNVVNITPSKLVGSVTVFRADHQLHAGGEQRRTGHADRQPQRQHPGELQHHAGAGGQRGQRQRQHRQLQRLGQRRGLPATSQSPRAAR